MGLGYLIVGRNDSESRPFQTSRFRLILVVGQPYQEGICTYLPNKLWTLDRADPALLEEGFWGFFLLHIAFKSPHLIPTSSRIVQVVHLQETFGEAERVIP